MERMKLLLLSLFAIPFFFNVINMGLFGVLLEIVLGRISSLLMSLLWPRI